MENKQPIRTMDKKEAVRHLIHAAIRMLRAAEDPFAINVLIQSADKMLTDISKKQNKQLVHEWAATLSAEHRDRFFKAYREIYNYFKHADRDHDKRLRVPDMMLLNIMVLTVCIENYAALFGGRTQHMNSHLVFAMASFPGSTFKDIAKVAQFKAMELLTPEEFFAGLDHPDVASRFPGMDKEKLDDLKDVGAFYKTNITDLEDVHFRRR